MLARFVPSSFGVVLALLATAAHAEAPSTPGAPAESAKTTLEPPSAKPPAAPRAGRRDVTLPRARRPTPAELDYDTPRLETAAFPLLGGDSDIGFEFGGVGTLTRFAGGTRPYAWNMDLLLATSVKSGPRGLEFTQQSYLWQIDVPRAFGSSVRLNPAVMYSNTINHGYFGIGNDSSATRPPVVNGEPARYFQFDEREARLRVLTRIGWRPPWDIGIATTLRYAAPSAYAGSKLAEDVNAGGVLGYRKMTLGVLGAGLIYDTRDNEYFPHHGAFHQIAVRGVQGFPFDAHVAYAAFGAVLAGYVPVGGPVVFAARGLLDAEVGNVPFFDLYTGGPFRTLEMIGGAEAVRGVPNGRYLGKLKVIGNAELRALMLDFRLLGQSFHLGGNLLFDTGRLWSDYSFSAPADGPAPGLKWGAGGGVYLIWGQAAVFRIEAAYSPDAVAQNPTLPVGVYVADGVMF